MTLYSRSASPVSSTAVDSTGSGDMLDIAIGAPEELSIFRVDEDSAANFQVAADGSGSFRVV